MCVGRANEHLDHHNNHHSEEGDNREARHLDSGRLAAVELIDIGGHVPHKLQEGGDIRYCD
eukprot:19946-Eustigmatos_ZCMA.PRE.1